MKNIRDSLLSFLEHRERPWGTPVTPLMGSWVYDGRNNTVY